MGFRIRKSIKLFPGLGFNLSKKEIGFSAGMKGLRINNRGQYNLGTGPITYQGSLGKGNGNKKIIYILATGIVIYLLMR